MTRSNNKPTGPISMQTNMTANIKVVGAPIIVGKLIIHEVIVPTSINQ